MKNLILHSVLFVLIFTLKVSNGFCQKMEELSDVKIKDSVYSIVDEDASFPGGNKALMKFIQDNLVFPEGYGDIDVVGKIYVSFIVRKDGTCSDFIIKRGIPGAPEFDKMALDLMKKMPKWIPAKVDGKAVDAYHSYPIYIELE